MGFLPFQVPKGEVAPDDGAGQGGIHHPDKVLDPLEIPDGTQGLPKGPGVLGGCHQEGMGNIIPGLRCDPAGGPLLEYRGQATGQLLWCQKDSQLVQQLAVFPGAALGIFKGR